MFPRAATTVLSLARTAIILAAPCCASIRICPARSHLRSMAVRTCRNRFLVCPISRAPPTAGSAPSGGATAVREGTATRCSLTTEEPPCIPEVDRVTLCGWATCEAVLCILFLTPAFSCAYCSRNPNTMSSSTSATHGCPLWDGAIPPMYCAVSPQISAGRCCASISG